MPRRKAAWTTLEFPDLYARIYPVVTVWAALKTEAEDVYSTHTPIKCDRNFERQYP
jgi:hypothetical protein